MEVWRLNKDNFIPDLYIEGGEHGYTSMIWTERYNTDGEFELKTPLVDWTKNNLPEGSLITHRETNETMMVETHSIGRDSDGAAELTVTGRALTAFTNFRHLEGPYPKKKYKMSKLYSTKEAALILLWNSLVNPTTHDVTRAGPWERDILDTVPDSVVTDSTTKSRTPKKRWLTGGQMGPQLNALLVQGNIGFRTIRPNTGPARRVSVSTDDKGGITYTNDSYIPNLRWDLYDGVDRRYVTGNSTEVIFSYAAGHVDEPSYLWSISNYMTMAFVISGAGVRQYWRDRASEKTLGGLDRRVVWVDGGTIDLADIPSADDQKDNETDAEFRARVRAVKAQNTADKEEFKDNLDDMGEQNLDKTDKTHIMDGKISPDCPYEYGPDKHYYLGDTVSLLGEYGFNQPMRVAEYVRTDDAEGDRGYPGLVEVQ